VTQININKCIENFKLLLDNFNIIFNNPANTKIFKNFYKYLMENNDKILFGGLQVNGILRQLEKYEDDINRLVTDILNKNELT
jgi:hypothetical protein